MAKQGTALQLAIEGKELNDKQAKGALNQAVSRIANLSKKAESSKLALVETGTQAMHLAEVQGSLFLSSMTEGYLGPEKLKVGGVDLRAPVGLLSAGYGLYQTLNGESAGGHALALGNGILGSWLASVGRDAGQMLAEKRHTPAQPVVAAPAPQAALRGEGAPGPSAVTVQRAQSALLPAPRMSLSGPVREVLLSPAHEEVAGPRRRVEHREERRNSRFPTARSLEEEPGAA